MINCQWLPQVEIADALLSRKQHPPCHAMQMQCDALQDKSTRLLVEERAIRVSILPNLNESRVSIRLQSPSTCSSRGHYLKSISLRRADQTTPVDSGKASHQSTAA
jgi:hypothetical protein